MNKKYIIGKNQEIQNVIKNGVKKSNQYFVLYELDGKYTYSRFCISVGKKIGKAVTRNLIKRRIKNILNKINLENNKDYVIIIRNLCLNISYIELEKELIEFLKERK